jgi:hypothetical protein
VRISSPGDNGDNSSHSEFRAFFNRPLHAVELKDRQQQRESDCSRLWRDFFAEFEVHQAICYRDDYALADHSVGNDIELLSDPGTQDTNQVVGVSTGEGSSVTRDLIGDPSATRHATAQYREAFWSMDFG